MANFDQIGGLSTKDDETLSVSAVIDIDLDSTGAGSPPPTSSFDQGLLASAAERRSTPTMHPDAHNAGPSEGCSTDSSKWGPVPPTSTLASLESALGEVLVISGGSGYNDLVGATPGATYVMPISDNGGSSSEIIRVLGGPSIGDIRSRLNRLIPTPSRHDVTATSSTTSAPPKSNEAIHKLLSYRLPSHGQSREIKQEWMDILEGRHPLWRGIEPERKEVIRGFLVHFESEVLRRAHRQFNFRGGSIGNFFLAAAQKFFRSIQSAIFLFSSTTQINGGAGKVLPVINTNHTATIAAELEDGEIIVGQCEISHPAPKPKSQLRLQHQQRTGIPRIALPDMPRGATAMERGGSLASQPPGTPSSAAGWDVNANRADQMLLAADAGLLGDGGPSTPGFGPPAHYHINNEPFSSSNYTSMNASMDALDLQKAPSPLSTSSTPGSTSKLGAKSATAGPSPLFAQLVEERAAKYHAHAHQRKGLTTVGNQKDGLDPEDDDQEDSQDGHDPIDSPLDNNSAAEEDAYHNINNTSKSLSNRPKSLPRREKTGNIIFSKQSDDNDNDHEESPLPSPIKRILYVNAYRNEIYPAPNPSFVSSLSRSKTLIYSCGSLWTSIIPCLSLRGIASTIATSPNLRFKILLLNSVQDRETNHMTDALSFIHAISDSLNQNDQPNLLHSDTFSPAEGEGEAEGRKRGWKVNQLITHLVYFLQGQIKVDVPMLEKLGVKCVMAETRLKTKNGIPKFDEDSVRDALFQITTESD